MLTPKETLEKAPKYYEENLKFRVFLKNRARSRQLDKDFARLHKQLFKGYDCCACANCCRAFCVVFNEEDISSTAAFLGISDEEFLKKYLTENDGEIVHEPPCTFLEDDGKCRIQSCKPEECKGFPFTDQPDRIGSLYGVMDFSLVCPVVFEIVARLKDIYGFKSRVRG